MGIYDNVGGITTVIEQKKTMEKEKQVNGSSVGCFVMLENSEAFNIDEKSYNLELLGNPMFTWVCRACPSIPITVEYERNSNILEIIRPYLKDTEYTLVLFSDTPLLTRGSVDEILEYMANKGLNVCKLTRGYVFKTEYIKRVGEIFAPQTYYFDEEDFITAVNFKQLALVADILKNRIIEYHMNNGVYFENPDMTIIESNVTIGKNTRISGNTHITGKTEIGEYCKLVNANINGSKLYDRVEVSASSIEKSVIESDVCLNEGTKVFDGALIHKNSNIGRNNVICKSSIGENAEIGNNNYIANARIHNYVRIGSKNKFVGEENKIIRVLTGTVIANDNQIKAGVMIGENVNVSSHKQIMNNIKQGEII